MHAAPGLLGGINAPTSRAGPNQEAATHANLMPYWQAATVMAEIRRMAASKPCSVFHSGALSSSLPG